MKKYSGKKYSRKIEIEEEIDIEKNWEKKYCENKAVGKKWDCWKGYREREKKIYIVKTYIVKKNRVGKNRDSIKNL